MNTAINTQQHVSTPGEAAFAWPRKYSLFGVQVSATSYKEVITLVIDAAKNHRSAIVDFTPVSVLIGAVDDLVFRSKLNDFDIACPDGQPVRWCLNRFHNAGLTDRVCGTTTMLKLCEAAAREGVSIYLYGSTPETLRLLQMRLLDRFPRLQIAGAESPPFRLLSSDEQGQVVRRINATGAGLVFLGTGSPKQEAFAWEHKADIHAVQLCVGAAYDFIAGTQKRAPEWMQRLSLEWLYRVSREPLRLGKRYLWGNMRFAHLLVTELALRTWGHDSV